MMLNYFLGILCIKYTHVSAQMLHDPASLREDWGNLPALRRKEREKEKGNSKKRKEREKKEK